MDEKKKKAFVMNALLMAHADGSFDPEQRQLIRAFMEKAGVDNTQARRWFMEMKAGDISFRSLGADADRIDMIKLAIGIVGTDGKLDERERRDLLSLGKALGFTFDALQDLVRQYWGKDVLEDIFKPPEAPPATSEIIVITDHFDRFDKLEQVSAGIHFDPLSLAQLAGRKARAAWVLFHVTDDKDETLKAFATIQKSAPGAHIVGVVGRHQGFLVSYLLERGAYRCLVEDIYPGELQALLSSDP